MPDSTTGYVGDDGHVYASQAQAWEYGQATPPPLYRAGWVAGGALLALLASGFVYGAYGLGGAPMGVAAGVVVAIAVIFAGLFGGE